jgi:hypothetical protein
MHVPLCDRFQRYHQLHEPTGDGELPACQGLAAVRQQDWHAKRWSLGKTCRNRFMG